ncbi:MAG TPA: aminotransferase class III-fold pyridoxal phosphate-dependent enzyme [Steroidobacteraceae bacterium]|jgi:acetylornithine/succinyldiaminopimelate/putrescine aminotransferase|nr:aminotransferase class III-fold pyridoxal phosphate-dependent enzyme [Steroidobacteraceae bacterium]
MNARPSESTAAASPQAIAAQAAAPAALPDYLAPVFSQYPLPIVSAEGVWLTTRDGRRVLDLYGGHAVAALGYGHPGWTTALTAQARTLSFQSNAVPLDVRLRAAQRLIRFSGLDFSSVFFVNSGAEANENALKMAFTCTQRTHVAAIEHSFHGRTAAAGAVTWGAAAKWYAFPRAPFDVSFIPRRDTDAIAAHVTERTAAVIVEPVQGVGGAFHLGAPFLAALRARCDEVGALLICDEVQCGMGRAGEAFAAKLYGVQPDMITTAKALGAGFPCGALLMAPRVAAAVKLDALGTTFGGGPMACAVIEAVIEAIESEQLLERVRARSQQIRSRCLVGPVVAHQGEGLLLGLRTTRPAKQVHAALLERGILTGTSADPHILRLLPPYVLAAEHVELLRGALLDIGA